jgi:hypothetical protein
MSILTFVSLARKDLQRLTVASTQRAHTPYSLHNAVAVREAYHPKPIRGTMRTQLVAAAFAVGAAIAAIAATPVFREAAIAFAYDESCGSGTAVPCWHDRQCLKWDSSGECVHTSDSWMYYPMT